jgi:hypothetical protein
MSKDQKRKKEKKKKSTSAQLTCLQRENKKKVMNRVKEWLKW